MEDRKIPVKNLYLVLVICIGLVCLGIGSTYAVFTAEARIGSPISLASNLVYDGSLSEMVMITIPANGIVNQTINITNSTADILNYIVYYVKNDIDVVVGIKSGTPTGSLTSTATSSLEITIKNKDDVETTVSIGILSDTDDLVLSSGMILLPDERLLIAEEFSYDNSKTGVDCTDVQCMIDLLDTYT